MPKKIKTKDMLVNQKGFIKSCDILRRAINNHKEKKSLKTLLKIIRVLDNAIIRHNCSQTTLIECSGSSMFYLRSQYRLFDFEDRIGDRKVFLLKDKHHYARLIVDEMMTVSEVAKKFGTQYATVALWVDNYKSFGYDMLNNAIAFRHEMA